jgi:hypothetical protein
VLLKSIAGTPLYRPQRRLLAAILVIGAACADQGTAAELCAPSVAVTVSSGLHPAFNWTPGCPIEGLIVALPGPGAVVWSVISHDLTNRIYPVVHYGVEPPGAALTANILMPLVAGTTYQVVLLQADASQGGRLRSLGSATFVP